MDSFLPTIERSLVQILWAAVWLAGLTAIFVPLERLFAIHPQKIWRQQILTDIIYYFVNGLIPTLMLSIPLAVIGWAARSFVPSAIIDASSAWPFWWRALAAHLVGEIGYYWGHRWSHENPLLWRFHSIHHSAEELDFLVATRAHPIDQVFTRICMFIPMYVLGLAGPRNATEAVQIPLAVAFFAMVWGFFVHANLRWRFGPLEWIISTPGFHHWHHTKTGPINRNYASTLPWLDWIFGTHYLPNDASPSSYGIQARIPDSLIGQLVYPFEYEPAGVSETELDSTTLETDPNHEAERSDSTSAAIQSAHIVPAMDSNGQSVNVNTNAADFVEIPSP
jgi:sterol desaturase/sphingolipid hydroxylase (fatty acid hydroxylase superfamily)